MDITRPDNISRFECPACGAWAMYDVRYDGFGPMHCFRVTLRCHGRVYALNIEPDLVREAKLDIREIITAQLRSMITDEVRRRIGDEYEYRRRRDRSVEFTDYQRAIFESETGIVRPAAKQPEPAPEEEHIDLLARPIRKIELE